MMRRFEENATSTALIDAFDEIELATITVDRFAGIRFANRSAKRPIDEGGVILDLDRKLAVCDPEANIRLRQEIFDLATLAPGADGDHRAHFVLPREGSSIGLQATVSPLDGSAGLAASEVPPLTWAVVFLNDPLRSYETRAEQLQRLFGLTATEAEVARRFAEGGDLRGLAEDTGRTYETVRWQLKQVMSKVGVSRQSEPVRVLAASSPPIRPHR
jgi:DNA-binding CsgD family transcriptional regulator